MNNDLYMLQKKVAFLEAKVLQQEDTIKAIGKRVEENWKEILYLRDRK